MELVMHDHTLIILVMIAVLGMAVKTRICTQIFTCSSTQSHQPDQNILHTWASECHASTVTWHLVPRLCDLPNQHACNRIDHYQSRCLVTYSSTCSDVHVALMTDGLRVTWVTCVLMYRITTQIHRGEPSKGLISLKNKDRAVATLLQSVDSPKCQITLALAMVACEVSGWAPELGECLLEALHIVVDTWRRFMQLGLCHRNVAPTNAACCSPQHLH